MNIFLELCNASKVVHCQSDNLHTLHSAEKSVYSDINNVAACTD